MSDTPETKGRSERREDIYFWRDFNHLRDAYTRYLTPKEIEDIVARIKQENRFVKRSNVTDAENEADLCNLIEREILKQHKL